MSRRTKMKRVAILLLVSCLFGALSPAASPAGDGAGVTVLYTGAVQGSVEPVSS